MITKGLNRYNPSIPMIRIVQSPLDGYTRVVFELPDGLWADRVNLVGDFNNWNPGDQDYAFRTDSLGRQYYTLVTDMEIISFKITRGNWKSVETLPSARDIPNRTFMNGQSDTVFLRVERWKDR